MSLVFKLTKDSLSVTHETMSLNNTFAGVSGDTLIEHHVPKCLFSDPILNRKRIIGIRTIVEVDKVSQPMGPQCGNSAGNPQAIVGGILIFLVYGKVGLAYKTGSRWSTIPLRAR